MSTAGFHDKPYDAGTLTKLKIFELYVQEWIPVFISRPDPPFEEIHLFDLFCGPGKDPAGVHGSPLRILGQLRRYHSLGKPGWAATKIFVHLSDSEKHKIDQLRTVLDEPKWNIPGVTIDATPTKFQEALERHRPTLANPRAAKLLIIDQYGVDAVTEPVFNELITSPRTDFMFFVSSSTLHRFRDHPAIKIKIEEIEDSYDVHRAAFDWYQNLTPSSAFLGRFSIKKGSNIYGLIFGSQHPLGAHKFLEVAWKNDEIAGEADFDINRENISPGELLLPLDGFRPKKINAFEADLEAALRSGVLESEADLVHFCISAGMTCQHVTPVLKKLKDLQLIECEFRTPNVRNVGKPRPIRRLSS